MNEEEIKDLQNKEKENEDNDTKSNKKWKAKNLGKQTIKV
jgi:hypothetical protein